MMRFTSCFMPPGGAADIVDDGGADLYRVLAQKMPAAMLRPDFGAQLVAILVVYRRRAHGHGLVAPVTFNTGISQGSRSSSFVRPASRSERLAIVPVATAATEASPESITARTLALSAADINQPSPHCVLIVIPWRRRTRRSRLI